MWPGKRTQWQCIKYFYSHISTRCDLTPTVCCSTFPNFYSHISTRCDSASTADGSTVLYFYSHISTRCDIDNPSPYIVRNKISTHTSLRDVTIMKAPFPMWSKFLLTHLYEMWPNAPPSCSTAPAFLLTHLYEMWPLYIVRDNFQTTKYSNSKQNIITLNTKVPKIIAKRVVFSAKASEKRTTLQVRLPMYKIIVILPQPI